MTQSKTQMIKYFLFLLIFLLRQSAVCNGSFIVNGSVPDSASVNKSVHETAKKLSAHTVLDGQKSQQHDAVLLSGSTTTIPDGNKTLDNITSKQIDDKATQTTESRKEHASEGHAALNTGALKRGFYVFVGLSILIMAYIVFRSLRLSKTRAQMIRKYGVLAHRQDVEMRPLPLDEEDDEDTTVFDASSVLTTNAQHQNL